MNTLEELLQYRTQESIKFLCLNGFPEISFAKVTIEIVKEDSFFMASYKNILYISGDCKKLSDSAFNGVLSHELIHIIEYIKYPFWSSIKNLLYTIPSFETYFERNTDKEVLRRGYGENLLEFIKYHDKHYKKYNSKDGLTQKELKKILNK